MEVRNRPRVLKVPNPNFRVYGNRLVASHLAEKMRYRWAATARFDKRIAKT